VAGFTGSYIQQLLTNTGIQTDFIVVDNGISRINIKLQSESDKETEINGMGPDISDIFVDELFLKLDGLQDGDILILAGSVPASMPSDIYRLIMDRLQSKSIEVIVDATNSLLWNVLEYGPFLIKPNHHELGELFGKVLNSNEEIIACAKTLQDQGARNVLVSMAEKGAILVTEEKEVLITNAPTGKVINSVGAGDSMVAGFVAGYLRNRSYKEALRYGVCSGSASAFSDNLATKEEVEKLLNENLVLINDYLFE
jgi:1-phosphofructokinase